MFESKQAENQSASVTISVSFLLQSFFLRNDCVHSIMGYRYDWIRVEICERRQSRIDRFLCWFVISCNLIPQGISEAIVKQLIEFAYTGNIAVGRDNVKDLLSAASKFVPIV